MNVILATWLDPRMDTFDIEVLDAKLDHKKILDFYIAAKCHYGHHVISDAETYAAFSDGTRVMLSLYQVKHQQDMLKINDAEDLNNFRMLE